MCAGGIVDLQCEAQAAQDPEVQGMSLLALLATFARCRTSKAADTHSFCRTRKLVYAADGQFVGDTAPKEVY